MPLESAPCLLTALSHGHYDAFSVSNMNDNADIERAKELLRLCRAGRLYEIERWIADGRSLDVSASVKRGRQKSLLEVAVELGFHSLVELIAKNEPTQSARDEALLTAIRKRRKMTSRRPGSRGLLQLEA